MCLHKIAKFKPKGIGYKVLILDSDSDSEEPRFEGMYFRRTKDSENTYYVLGETYTAVSDYIQYEFGSFKRYKSGFHIYQNLKDAVIHAQFPTWKVVKVSYPISSVITVGYESNRKVVVAKKMKILKEVTIQNGKKS